MDSNTYTWGMFEGIYRNEKNGNYFKKNKTYVWNKIKRNYDSLGIFLDKKFIETIQYSTFDKGTFVEFDKEDLLGILYGL